MFWYAAASPPHTKNVAVVLSPKAESYKDNLCRSSCEIMGALQYSINLYKYYIAAVVAAAAAAEAATLPAADCKAVAASLPTLAMLTKL